MIDLLGRYTNLMQRFGVATGTDEAGKKLLAAYDGKDRFYHNRAHLEDVLAKLDWAQDALLKTGETSFLMPDTRQRMMDTIELALFYHDAVYDAKAKDNEQKSREWMEADAKRFGIDPKIIASAAALIDMTAHHKTAHTLPENIMADCDLAIFGAKRETFVKYDQAIRQEYAHVPKAVYDTVRPQVLKSFLEQDRIFKTKAFHDAFETRARKNLRTSTRPKPFIARLLGM